MRRVEVRRRGKLEPELLLLPDRGSPATAPQLETVTKPTPRLHIVNLF